MKTVIINLQEEMHQKLTKYCYEQYTKSGKKTTMSELVRELLQEKLKDVK